MTLAERIQRLLRRIRRLLRRNASLTAQVVALTTALATANADLDATRAELEEVKAELAEYKNQEPDPDPEPTGVPRNVTVEGTGDTRTLRWEAPAGPAPSAYAVGRNGQDTTGSGPWSTEVPATARSHVFRHIGPDSPSLWVAAVDESGDRGEQVVVELEHDTEPSPDPDPDPTPDPDPEPGDTYASGHTWMSGASGQTVENGTFATWRGSPLDIVGTWNDSREAQTAQWSLEAYNGWNGDVDNAIGAIFGGESWSAAANGAYDARWTRALQKVNELRQGKGRVYLRFAHEFNGDWYDWSVRAGQEADFVKAWRRFHGLFEQHMDPRHQLVYSPNWDTTMSGLDIRATWPGKDYVDVISPDYYNQYPYNTTRDGWWSTMTSREGNGGPKGMETWRQFAEQQGLPIGLSEWGGRAPSGGQGGDNPAFVTFMHEWMGQHAGTGPGDFLYEIYFNVNGFGDNQFEIYPTTKMPKVAAKYRELW